jgi:hypothetical protein
MPNPAGISRYLIRAAADGPALAAFIGTVRANSAVRVVETIGPRDMPHTLVIETDTATADGLKESFRTANQLMIEPDRPLSLFD